MGDTDLPGIGWREYVDMRFTAAAVALEVAHRELDRRLEDMNQFREENRRQAGTSVTRELYQADIDRLEALIATEREARRAAEGSISTWRFIAIFIGLPGILAFLAILGSFAGIAF